jgi:hypothetical protein
MCHVQVIIPVQLTIAKSQLQRFQKVIHAQGSCYLKIILMFLIWKHGIMKYQHLVEGYDLLILVSSVYIPVL